MRVVVRQGFSRDMADMLLGDINNAVAELEKLDYPTPTRMACLLYTSRIGLGQTERRRSIQFQTAPPRITRIVPFANRRQSH